MTEPLLLASASPRRRQMLSRLGLPFIVGVAPVDEEEAQERYRGPVEGLAEWLAKHKAAAALSMPEAAGRLVITADTTVLLNDTILGKPRDAAHARELLLMLRGRVHHVVTGVAVSGSMDGKFAMRSASCITPVRMRAYSEAEVAAYIATGDPMDKAGSYGIQHPSFQPTANIDGCYLNVVGLPLCVLVDLLAEFNVYPAVPLSLTTDCPWSERCRI
ncbi:MAG TPA: Maf family protein [Ktedonobacteraceae bacterium]|nr:Maf family protein [Ktedonobacteraceae bacterium]